MTPRVRHAIQAAREAGCLLTLATGRRLVTAQALAADLALRLPLILHSGAVIQDSASGAVIYQDAMEPDTVAGVVEAIGRHGFPPIVYESPANGGRLYTNPDGPTNRPTDEYERLRGPFVRVPTEELARVRQVLSLAALGESGELVDLADELACRGDVTGIRAPWSVVECEAIEIFRAGCSKATAVEQLAAAHAIAMDEVMAIGDGLNDCELLGAVGWGVAMGNACPEACAAACVQVGTNARDGVAEAIERFVLSPQLSS
ncbi:MAG TPA: HAD family hydrolase [Chloroflexota bacterium]|nr:HAD family hydrolase [Chloroflexota bacterium]